MPFPLNSAPRSAQKATGFTLIELLIVIVLISVLAAVAMPIYQSQVLRSRRIDAKGAILELAARQENFFAMNNRFSSLESDFGYTTLPMNIVSSGGASYYSLSVSTTNSNQAFTALATPRGSQVTDTDCFIYTVDQTGNKTQPKQQWAALEWQRLLVRGGGRRMRSATL